MKSLICFFFLFVTLSNAFRITKFDPTNVVGIISHRHHHHHVDHNLRSKHLSDGSDSSKIILPTESSPVPDHTKSSALVKNHAIEDSNLHGLTKVHNDHLQPLDQLQVHPIIRFNQRSLPTQPHNPHKCRHHLRLIAYYYPRLIPREVPSPRDLPKGRADHELQMFDQFTGPHYIISRHHPNHHHHDHHDDKDDQTFEEKTAVEEDQHEEKEKKVKEHEPEIREKDLSLKFRKFLAYF